MKGGKLPCLLLMLVASCTGCRESTRVEVPGGIEVKTLPQENGARVSRRLPDTLMGVWYRDDTEGASKCDRYRALPGGAGQTDEAVIVLVGSLVVTSNLIHEVAEYGEGNFHAVEVVEPADDDAWRITTRLGIDSIPDDSSGEQRVVSRLSLRAGKLQWRALTDPDAPAPRYVRCGAVRPDGHHPVSGEETREVES